MPHVGRDVVVNMDLKDFFPTVTFPRPRGLLQGLGYSPAVATILALLCTDCPRRTAEYDGKVYHVATGPRALPQARAPARPLATRGRQWTRGSGELRRGWGGLTRDMQMT